MVLIDINGLLALAWPNHPHHVIARDWFIRIESAGWATCSTTQLGFIRLSSHPAFSANHTTPPAAHQLLQKWMLRPSHTYWQEEPGGVAGEAFQNILPMVVTHNFVTDAFLVAVAGFHGGRLATFDRPLKRIFKDAVELIA